jgi:protein ImuB
MLWIAVYLPEWSLQLAERARGNAASCAFVVTDGPANRAQVHAANGLAVEAGITPGMRVSAAQALVTDLLLVARNVEAEVAALQCLATWAGQFTPAVVCESGQGLLLEVQASLTLFKDLPQLLNLIRRGLHELGYHSVLGVAPSARGAWLLAKASLTQTGIRSCTELAELPARLHSLPLSLFDWPEDIQSVLTTLAIKTLGQFRALPRVGARQRFGAEALLQIDQAYAVASDVRPYHQAPDRYRTHIDFLQEVTQVEALLFSIKRMLLELEGFLRARGAGVQEFVLTLEHASRDKLRSCICIGLLSPERDATRLLALARERLERHPPRSPVLSVSLEANAPLPYTPINHSLLPDTRNQILGWGQLRERLQARLGQAQLFVLQPGNDHRPECATVLANPREPRAKLRSDSKSAATGLPHAQPRPLWLLPQPAPLVVVEAQPHYHGALTLRAGPERLETGWWDGQRVNRDYYVACNKAGETVWIYHEHQQPKNWFLHGVFA